MAPGRAVRDLARHRGCGPGPWCHLAGPPSREPSARQPASASTRARTSAPSATPAPSSPTTTGWRPGCARCPTTGGPTAPTSSTSCWGATAAWTACRPGCCTPSCPGSTPGTRPAGRPGPLRRAAGRHPGGAGGRAPRGPQRVAPQRGAGAPARPGGGAAAGRRHRCPHPLPAALPPPPGLPRGAGPAGGRGGNARLLSLPIFPTITDDQIDRVCDELVAAMTGAAGR